MTARCEEGLVFFLKSQYTTKLLRGEDRKQIDTEISRHEERYHAFVQVDEDHHTLCLRSLNPALLPHLSNLEPITVWRATGLLHRRDEPLQDEQPRDNKQLWPRFTSCLVTYLLASA